MTFQNKLVKIQKKNNSLVCVGLDSDIEKIPPHLRKKKDPVFEFNKAIIKNTHNLVCAYKPNIAFYEAHGDDGLKNLKKTMDYLHKNHPEVPVILDAKRGDIGHANSAYIKLIFDYLGADAVTLHPYLGKESLLPFLALKNKFFFILCRTSNPGAGEFQDLKVGKQRLYQYVAKQVAGEWNVNKNVGLVVGATYPQELKAIRKMAQKTPLLIPGVGKQGGDIEKTIEAADGGPFLINSSRSIIFASQDKNFAKAAKEKTLLLKNIINQSREEVKNKEKVVLALFKIGAIKFGSFKLKSGLISPYYLDLRFLCSYPKILKSIAAAYAHMLKKLKFDLIAGVPYTGIPISTAIAVNHQWPMIFTRKEAKDHGIQRPIEGLYKKGQKVVIIDDVITDGASKFEMVNPLKHNGLKVKDVIVLLDRGQGGPENLRKKGFACHSLFTMQEVLQILKKHNKITEKEVKNSEEFMSS